MINFNINSSAHEYFLFWSNAVLKKQYDLAANIDFIYYERFIKPTENQEIWDQWQIDTFELRKKLSDEFIKYKPTNFIQEKTNRTLIVQHNFSGLAHETQLSRNLQSLRQMGQLIDFDVAYLFGGNKEKGYAASKIYQTSNEKIIFLQAQSYTDAGHRINSLLIKNRYDTVIYITNFFMAFWVSLITQHSNQKFLVLKYFPKQVGRIKEWSCIRRTNSNNINVQGGNFRQLDLLSLDVCGNVDYSNLTNKIDKVTFGSISRPEKAASENYNQFIKQTLSANPNSVYLYTCRKGEEHKVYKDILEHPQAYSLGWVNPSIGINKYSIYLETFPWGGGDMTFLALNSGLPYLTLETEENRRVGVLSIVERIMDSGDPELNFSICENLSTLSERLNFLLNNHNYRIHLGKLWKDACRKYKPIDIHPWVEFLTT